MCAPLFVFFLLPQDEKDRKRQEAAERRAANREALDAEENSLKKDSGVRSKMTVAEIQAVNTREKKADAVVASAAKKTKKEESVLEKLEENPNQQIAKLMATEGAIEARSVEDAIAVLSVAEVPVERHPERRMKAAYNAFEERELPRLKQENPNLRLSQLKQLLKKEWMKSPENPMNMAFTQYNEKKS